MQVVMKTLSHVQKKFHTKIVGLYYAKSESLVSLFPLHTRLMIWPEPTNKYDPQAVAVLYGGKHLGYIPRDQTRIIHAFLAKGFTVVGQSGLFHPKHETEDYEMVPAYLEILVYFDLLR